MMKSTSAMPPVAIDDDGSIWMVFEKVRHRVVGEGVYEDLFNRAPIPVANEDLSSIQIGLDVCSGSVLARSDDSIDIFFVTGYPITKKYKVANYETFEAYGFKMDAVRSIPILIMEQVPLGPSIMLSPT